MAHEPPTDDDELGAGAAAALLGVHKSTLSRYATQGHLTYRELPGGYRRYSRKQILELKARGTHTPESEQPS